MKKIYLITTILIIFTGCKDDIEKPKLVIFISIDQLSEQMFDHYHDLFGGGYQWMIEHGNWYTNLHYEHWYSVTAAGHFVLSSGQHPKKGGIFGNNYYDRDLKRQVYSVEDKLSKIIGKNQEGVSYRNIPTTTLGDWLKIKHPESKVISVAGKDRSAILLAGKYPDMAVWWDWRGNFITSDYYSSENPDWLTQYNENNDLTHYRDSLWTRELDADIYDTYTRIDAFEGEDDLYNTAEYSPIFPIGFDSTLTDEQVLEQLADGPWVDREILNLAKILLKNEELGKDSAPDILFVGLSGTDAIGHNWGPYSHEGMDNQLKIDIQLQKFIEFIDKNIGLDNVLFVLSADHGVLPLPEYLKESKNISAGRINREAYLAARATALAEIEIKFGSDLVHVDFNEFYYDIKKIINNNKAKTEIDQILKRNLVNVEGISLISKDEILQGDPNDKIISRFQNLTDPHKGPDLIALPKKYWTFRYPRGTTHGSPYSYDTNVPLIIAHQSLSSKKIDKYYGAVDIAPTIAKILGVEAPQFVDGKPLF